MRILGVFFSLAAFVLPGVSGSAQVESTPVPLSSKPDFSKMLFLTGTWNCTVRSSRRPGPYMTTLVGTMNTNGYWIDTRTTVHKAPWIPRSFVATDHLTWDASTSRWVDVSTDEIGGYDLSTSTGWHGNKIVWTDVAYPKSNATAVNNPTTMTKLSDTKTSSVNTFKEPSGRTVSVTTNCTKQ